MDAIGDRLGQLRVEYDKSIRQLELLRTRRDEVRDLMLRISGAIQVLEELASAPANGASSGAEHAALEELMVASE